MIASAPQHGQDTQVAWLFALPALLGLFCFVLLPFALAVVLSFTNLRLGSPLPLQLARGSAHSLDLFFPLAPAPLELRLVYEDVAGVHTIVVDTREALDGLHLAAEED